MNFDDVNLDNSYGPVKAYCQSKLANVLFSSELARRLEGKAGGLEEWQSVSTQRGILTVNPCNWFCFRDGCDNVFPAPRGCTHRDL
jgi:hypothetical protein